MRYWKKDIRAKLVAAAAVAALALGIGFRATAEETANHDDGAGKSDGAHQLAPLDRLIGEWTIEAEWGWGEKLKGRNVYEWAEGGKVIKAATYVNKPDGGEYCRYESFIGWDAENQKPVLLGFGFDGSIYEAYPVFEGENKERIRYEYAERFGTKRTNIDQYNEFLDDDTMRWVVNIKDGDKSQQVMDANWIRTK